MKMNLLLVDDNPADLFYIKEILEDETQLDANIFEANNLKDATSIIENESIDITLLDLFLPDSTGIDTFHKLNSIQKEQNIIVLSGLKDEEIALATVRSGAQDFILKGEYNGKLLEKTIIYSIERNRNEKLLRVSNQKYVELFQKSPLPLFIVDPTSSLIRQSNKAANKLFGYSDDEFKKINFGNLLIRDSNTSEKGIWIAKIKNGLQIYVHISKQKVSFENDNSQLIQVENVTERVKFERNRMEMINSIQDNERENFAMELHDGLAQEMVLMNLYIEQIKEKCADVAEIDKIRGIIKSSMVQIRRLTYNASPPLLNDGLFEGLKVLFKRFDSVNEINISLNIDQVNAVQSDCLSIENAYNAFRIVQEFLNNSIKHADASNIIGNVNFYDKSVYIEVSDDGVGFDMDKLGNNGMGLKNMRRRAEIFNIDLNITPKLNEGTSLLLKIPMIDHKASEITL